MGITNLSTVLSPHGLHSKPSHHGAVEVDWGNDLTKGLDHLWIFNEGGGDTVYDLVGTLNLTRRGTAGWRAVESGTAGDLGVNDSGAYFDASPPAHYKLGTNRFTVFCGGIWQDQGTAYCVPVTIGSSAGNQGWSLAAEVTNNTGFAGFSTWNRLHHPATFSTPQGEEYFLAAAWHSTSVGAHLSLNGVTEQLATQGFVNVSTGIFQIGRYSTFGSNGVGNEAVSIAGLWTRDLSPNELSSLTADPWQLLEADPEPILFSIGAPPSGRIMSSLAAAGGLVGKGGLAGQGGGLAA